MVSLQRLNLVGSAIVDDNGQARIESWVESAAAGETVYIQAIDQQCRLSNLVRFGF